MSSAYVSPSRVVVLLPDPAARGRVFFEEQFYLLSHGNSNGCFLGFKPQRRNKAVGCARMWRSRSLFTLIVPWYSLN